MILERHLGKVEVKTKLGEGSTFEASIPSIDASEVASPKRVMILTPDAGLSALRCLRIAFCAASACAKLRQFRIGGKWRLAPG